MSHPRDKLASQLMLSPSIQQTYPSALDRDSSFLTFRWTLQECLQWFLSVPLKDYRCRSLLVLFHSNLQEWVKAWTWGVLRLRSRKEGESSWLWRIRKYSKVRTPKHLSASYRHLWSTWSKKLESLQMRHHNWWEGFWWRTIWAKSWVTSRIPASSRPESTRWTELYDPSNIIIKSLSYHALRYNHNNLRVKSIMGLMFPHDHRYVLEFFSN